MNKGFTLVELLAVIIILGILTLITIVSVSPILKDAKKGLTDTQIENIKEVASLYYIKHGVGIDDFEIDTPRDCINVSELIETGYIENEEVTNPKTGEKILGSVKVTYNSNNYIYEYQDNACTNYDKGIICERVKSTDVGNVPEGKFIAGDAYNCKVDPDKDPYKFYILTTPSETSDMINLIMDQNINSDGTPAGITGIEKNGESVYNIVGWCGNNEYRENNVGPIAAMQFLYNATKDWSNIEPLTYKYIDREFQGASSNEDDDTYESFISNNGIAIITSLSGNAVTIGTKEVPLRARMPIYSATFDSNGINISEKGELLNKKTDNSNKYLYENLNNEELGYSPFGYWTLSSSLEDALEGVWFVGFGGGSFYEFNSNDGFVDIWDCADDTVYGVRPVISVYKFQME